MRQLAWTLQKIQCHGKQKRRGGQSSWRETQKHLLFELGLEPKFGERQRRTLRQLRIPE